MVDLIWREKHSSGGLYWDCNGCPRFLVVAGWSSNAMGSTGIAMDVLGS